MRTPSLILQCAQDAIAPEAVGEYLARSLQKSQLVKMKATGHGPNLSVPQEMITALQAFLRERLPRDE